MSSKPHRRTTNNNHHARRPIWNWLSVAAGVSLLFIVVIKLVGGAVSFSASTAAKLFEGEHMPIVGDLDVQAEKKKDQITINLLASGDVVVHGPVIKSGQKSDGSYNYDHLWKHVTKEVKAADLALLSQETILGGKDFGYSGYPAFNGPTEIGDSEVKAGWDVLVKASNHVLDMGADGISAELAFWRTQHPKTAIIGMADSKESYDNIYVYEKEGFRVAFLNYTYDTNGIPIPESNPYATHLFDDDTIRADVARAKKKADLVVVWAHWGTEYQATPDEFQQHYAQLFNELGVDVVIGSHPHTIGPVDTMTNKSGHKMLIFYSLGNFMSNQIEGTMTSLGGQVKVGLVKDKDGARVAHWEFDPVVTQRAEGTDFSVYKLSDYTDELASKNLTPLTLESCHKYCEGVLGSHYDRKSCSLTGKL